MENELRIKNLRKEYCLKALDINDLNSNPFLQFFYWFLEAEEEEVPEANAMCLATAFEGYPSCRMVLLKKMDRTRLVFFTHYSSRKGRELSKFPNACVTFFWNQLERQVIIEGSVEKISELESQDYFASRPRESQLTAWASDQDKVLPSREALQENFARFANQFANQKVPMPPHWGGYALFPKRFEFWQGRQDRLHDRFSYSKQGSGWKIERIAP